MLPQVTARRGRVQAFSAVTHPVDRSHTIDYIRPSRRPRHGTRAGNATGELGVGGSAGKREIMEESKLEGIVTCGHGNRFTVFAGNVPYSCTLRKRIKFSTDMTTPVAVGDDVLIAVMGDRSGVIEEVRPRRTVLSRPMIGREDSEQVLAANIDFLVAVVSVAEPTLKPGLIDRFLVMAAVGGLTPVIVVNKADLASHRMVVDIVRIYRGLGYRLLLTSAVDGQGLEEFRDYLKDHRSILSGHSGVGKSSLLNRLWPGLNLRTSTISQATGKGRHTTSYVELFHLPDGGFVIDTPGIKVLGLWQLDRNNLADHYPEMQELTAQCRFTNCSHLHEPDCAVKSAVAAGSVTSLRYQNYCQIYDSL